VAFDYEMPRTRRLDAGVVNFLDRGRPRPHAVMKTSASAYR